eukprot:scaffold221813_cov18-Tisochrysis_lutea.AAC.1
MPDRSAATCYAILGRTSTLQRARQPRLGFDPEVACVPVQHVPHVNVLTMCALRGHPSAVTIVAMGCDLQPGRLADWLTAGLSHPKTHPLF